MNRQTRRKIARVAVPAVVAACAVTVPYVAATAGHRPAIAEAAGAASMAALAIPMTASTGELTGPGPRPPKPKPGGGGSSGYVWGAAEPDPTWQEQLGDLGDRG